MALALTLLANLPTYGQSVVCGGCVSIVNHTCACPYKPWLMICNGEWISYDCSSVGAYGVVTSAENGGNPCYFSTSVLCGTVITYTCGGFPITVKNVQTMSSATSPFGFCL